MAALREELRQARAQMAENERQLGELIRLLSQASVVARGEAQANTEPTRAA